MGFSTHLKGTAFDSELATFMKHLCNHIYISRLLRLAFLEFEYERGRERGRKRRENLTCVLKVITTYIFKLWGSLYMQHRH